MSLKSIVISYLKSKLRGEVPTGKLVKMGLKVGRNFNRQAGCIIDCSHCWLITIGDNVTFAPRVQVLAHDTSTKYHLNYTKIGLIQIGDNVFVGAGSIILPNVRIGNDVIIGAGSVVTRDVPNNSVVVGNPARVIAKVNEYVDNNRILMSKRPVFDAQWTVRNNISDAQKADMIKQLQDGIGFVE